MKNDFIHVCFVIDQSGSMMGSISDVEGGFKRIINEQKANDKGSCAVSLFTFDNYVHKIFVGKDVSEVRDFKFRPGGLTSMNDGICTAIDSIGKWLCDMPEEERPSKNLIVIITDGAENSSSKYSLKDVKDRIKHQTEKYSWEFIYLGTDITNTEQADIMGIKNQGYSIRSKMGKSYDMINTVTTNFRKSVGDQLCKARCMAAGISSSLKSLNTEYLEDTGIDLTKNKV